MPLDMAQLPSKYEFKIYAIFVPHKESGRNNWNDNGTNEIGREDHHDFRWIRLRINNSK